MKDNTVNLIAHIFDNSLRVIIFLSIIFALYRCSVNEDELKLKKAQIEHGCKP